MDGNGNFVFIHCVVYLKGLREEAKSCFEGVLEEGRKESNVDIEYMLVTSQRCKDVLQQIQQLDSNQQISVYLDQLLETVEGHIGVLSRKIDQLNTPEDQTVPSEPSTQSSQLLSDTESSPKKKKTTHINSTNSTSSGNKNGGKPEDKERAQRESAIVDTIMKKGKVTFADIAGLNEAKEALTEAFIMPLQFPHLFTGSIKPWKRILLYGPPGTGKSRLAEAISTEISSTFYCVSSSDIVSSWVGESEKLIKELFQHATLQSQRAVIFIDEIDSICRQRSSREEEHTRRMKTELLRQMEGADNSAQQDQIFMLCATNCPWELDTAFLRRFQKRIYIPLPDKEARISLIQIHTKDNVNSLTDADWTELARRTEGYSGSDIANMTLGALFGPIRELRMAEYWSRNKENKFTPCKKDQPGAFSAKLAALPPDQIAPRQVNLEDFLKSLQAHRRTITEEDLAKFTDFTSHYGEHG